MPAHARLDNELLDQTIKRTAEEISKRTTDNLKKVFEESSGNGGSKISQILRNAKGTSIDEIDKMRAEKEKLEIEKSRLEESITECPTCVIKGHSHALKNVGHGKLRCTGDGCDGEYSLIPNNADYKCVECGIPHKRPIKELEKEDSCPFCGSMEFIEQDYKRIKEKVSKKK